MASSSYQHLLVTGGAGFIGSNFVEKALKTGFAVTVLDALTYAGHRENLKPFESNPKFTFVKGDIRDSSVLQGIFSASRAPIDAVFHLAAESHVDRSIEGPSEFIQTNVMGSYQLLEGSLRYWETLKGSLKEKFRFIQVSTDEVFGSLTLENQSEKFSETTSYSPRSPYSASKAAGDHLARAWYHTFGLPTIVTNCSNNYGPRQFPEKLIPFMIQCALQGKPLGVYGEGKNVRDWIHVSDHCKGLLLALEKGRPGETYCFGGNAEKSNLEVVQMICKVMDELAPRKDRQSHAEGIRFVTDRRGHDLRYAIDDSLAEKELSFKRDHADFRSGLAETVKWYLDNQEWIGAIGKKPSSVEKKNLQSQERHR